MKPCNVAASNASPVAFTRSEHRSHRLRWEVQLAVYDRRENGTAHLTSRGLVHRTVCGATMAIWESTRYPGYGLFPACVRRA